MSDESILITGSAGFLGRNLYEHFNERGFDVKGLVHKQRVKGQRVIVGDLLDPDSFSDGLRDVDTVVHCAAKVGGNWSREQYRVNSEGTRNLLEGAIKAKVRKIIHISSLAVVDEYIDHNNTDESVGYPEKFRNHYISTKIAAEKILLEKKDDLKLIILRPGWLWGPGDRSMVELIELIKKNRFVFFSSGNNLTYFTHISNMLQAIELSLNIDEIHSGEIFNITDGVKLSMAKFINGATSMLGKPKITRHIPIWLANMSAFLIERFKPGTSYTRQNVAIMSKNLYFNITKAEKMLGYKPEKDWETNLKNMISQDFNL
jgi:nucleoside-diphosphate-sugar epimerase